MKLSTALSSWIVSSGALVWSASASAINDYDNKIQTEEEDLELLFERWRVRHGKTYSLGNDNDNGNDYSNDDDALRAAAAEYSFRKGIFRQNAATVANHNAAYEEGYTSYTMSVDGPFADLTDDEFQSLYLMQPQNCSATHVSSGPVPRKRSTTTTTTTESSSEQPLPEYVDWRTKGVLTHVKNQGNCGSCWTFSTTGTLEAHTCIEAKKDCTHWKGLAEQQLVDCAGDFNNNGCNGGLPSQAFEYIRFNGGIMTEDSYNYTAKDGICRQMNDNDSKHIGAKVVDVFNITSYDEDEIVTAVAGFGPVSVAYQVSPNFRFYSHGVYDSWNATTNQTQCQKDPSHVNHAVVAVGYGTTMDDKALPFYIIRNSWGNTWGMEGHFWMLRGQNLCGISDCASFPLVPSSLAPSSSIFSAEKAQQHLRASIV